MKTWAPEPAAEIIRDVARQVARRCPEAIMSFYCYADYTQAPSSGIELSDQISLNGWCLMLPRISVCQNWSG